MKKAAPVKGCEGKMLLGREDEIRSSSLQNEKNIVKMEGSG